MALKFFLETIILLKVHLFVNQIKIDGIIRAAVAHNN